MSATTAIQSVATPARAASTQRQLDGDGERDVGADGGERRAAEADGEGNGAQVVGHQRNVGGLDRGVGAGGAHGDADVGRGQRRRVVDAVADHGHRAELPTQLLDERDLVGRHQRRTHRIDLPASPAARAALA